MSRPKAGADKQRGQAIQVRVSGAEKRVFAKAAADAGLGLSAWLRALALKEARRFGVK